ncbi:MAG TPA: SRPBCC domain-containing protein [Myxococcaceae bacterium]|nr:SRPBCC domain-containing protein [Myxococcaceae bacterium]
MLVVRRLIRSTPEKVFRLWTVPELMARWMSPYPGPVRARVVADVRVGGSFRLEMGSEASTCEIEGTFLEVHFPSRLVFTWTGPPTLGAETLVTLALRAVAEGTELVLTHEKLPSDDVRKRHHTGWEAFLDHLETEAPPG